MDWILDNKEWIFSGIGVLLVGGVITFLVQRFGVRLAFLLGVAFLVGGLTGYAIRGYRAVEKQSLYRTYEWQWAGENWYGRISLANQNGKNVVTSMRVGELQKRYADGGDTFSFQIGPQPILELVEGGFGLDADRLTLDLTVRKKVIHSDVPARQRITGSLGRKLCFVGKVKYSDFAAQKDYVGDMILVDYISRFDERIENWFTSERGR